MAAAAYSEFNNIPRNGYRAPSYVSSVTVNALAQDTYYLEGRHGKGAFGRANLELVSPEVGAHEVANCKLISSP